MNCKCEVCGVDASVSESYGLGTVRASGYAFEYDLYIPEGLVMICGRCYNWALRLHEESTNAH